MSRIGIYGGTFNPIHNAHLNIAISAKQQYDLDVVYFLPAGQPPHKDCIDGSSVYDRVAMINAAINGYDCFHIDKRELNRPKISYTYITLQEYKAEHPDDDLFFIMGSDSIDYFDEWKNPEIISSLATILIAMRLGDNNIQISSKIDAFKNQYSGDFKLITIEQSSISSSDIRDRILKKIEYKDLIPETVFNYIIEHRIYGFVYDYSIVIKLLNKMREELKQGRDIHTVGVTYTASALASKWGYPVNNAMIAGALHDCAKCITDEKRIDICNKNNIPITDIEYQFPHLLHSKVGAYYAKNKYDIDDKDIIHAIICHTTGCANMSLLDKIIFVADYIEPGRDKAPRLEYLRRLAFEDIDKCCYEICYDTINYLSENPKLMDKTTIETFDYFAKLLGKETYGN